MAATINFTKSLTAVTLGSVSCCEYVVLPSTPGCLYYVKGNGVDSKHGVRSGVELFCLTPTIMGETRTMDPNTLCHIVDVEIIVKSKFE